MSLGHNPQPFSPQNSASVHPTGRTPPIILPFGTRPRLSYNQPDHPLRDVQVVFTHPVPIPQQQTPPNNQYWMPGQTVGTGSVLLTQERALNADIGMTSLCPPPQSNPMAIQDSFHPAGGLLARDTMKDNLFPAPEHHQAARTCAHQCQEAQGNMHTHARVTFHPSRIISCRKQPRPAAAFDPDVIQVQARCTTGGGDPASIGLLPAIFAGGISQNALTRQLTKSEADDYHNGRAGQVYRILLQIDENKMFHCRLCAVGADEGGWKYAKDALRHLKRDHFGLGTHCGRCGRIAYTTGELNRHRCLTSAAL